MKNIEKIQELLENFTFQELSEEQKAFVLNEISEQDYDANRKAIENISLEFEEEVEFEAQPFIFPEEKDESVIHKIMTYKIPVYKLVAGIAVVLISGYLLKVSTSDTQVQFSETLQNNEVSSFALESRKYNSNNSLLNDTLTQFIDFVLITDR